MPDFIASIFSTIHNFLFAGGCILITLFVMAIVGAISDKDWDALKTAFFAPGQTLRFSLDANHDAALFSLLHFVVSLLHPFFFIGYVVAAVYFAADSAFSFLFYFLSAFLALGYFVDPDTIKVQLSSNPKGRQNLVRLEAEVSSLLDEWEDKLNPMQQSAKPFVMELLKSTCSQKESLDLAATWGEDFDYSFEAHKCIYQLSCRALSSGKHHLSFGVLNPMGAGPHLLGFVRLYLRWAVDAGYMTPEEKEQELDFLHAEIKQVG